MKKGTKTPAKVRRMVSKNAVILETIAQKEDFAREYIAQKGLITLHPNSFDSFISGELIKKGMRAVPVNTQASAGSVIKSITDTEAIENIEEVLHDFALPKRKFVIQAVIGKTIADFKSLVHSLKNDKEAAENRLKNISDAVNASTVDLRDFEELLPQ